MTKIKHRRKYNYFLFKNTKKLKDDIKPKNEEKHHRKDLLSMIR